MILLIGIDWSQDHHDVCIMNETGAIIVRFEISHSPEGFAKLEKNIDKLDMVQKPGKLDRHFWCQPQ